MQIVASSLFSFLPENLQPHTEILRLKDGSHHAGRDNIFVKPSQDTLNIRTLSAFPRDSNAPSAAAEGGHGGRRTIPTSASRRRSMRIAHGTLMSVAFVLVLPLGAILLRMLGPKHRVLIHAATQLSAYGLAIAGLGLGIWLGLYVRYLDYAHTVIGMAVLATMLLQALLGGTHHMQYKNSPKKTAWGGLIHAWLGRALLALGIINGGLGLMLAENTKGGEIAYGVVAGVVGLMYLSVITLWLIRRKRGKTASLHSQSCEI